jgi:hypothetical protein
LFEIEWCYVVQASLELVTLLPHSPECWDYTYTTMLGLTWTILMEMPGKRGKKAI